MPIADLPERAAQHYVDSDKLMAVVAVLKKRFNNMSAEELLKLAVEILKAVS